MKEFIDHIKMIRIFSPPRIRRSLLLHNHHQWIFGIATYFFIILSTVRQTYSFVASTNNNKLRCSYYNPETKSRFRINPDIVDVYCFNKRSNQNHHFLKTESQADTNINYDSSTGGTWTLSNSQCKISFQKQFYNEENAYNKKNQSHEAFSNVNEQETMMKDIIDEIRFISTSILHVRRNQHHYHQNHNRQDKQKKTNNNKKYNKAIPYCRSLVKLLTNHSRSNFVQQQQQSTTSQTSKLDVYHDKMSMPVNERIDDAIYDELSDILSRATVQALRAAADTNDYILIQQIVRASIEFASSLTTSKPSSISSTHPIAIGEIAPQQRPMLQTRLFGEAIQTLTRTTAGYSKFRSLWQDFKKAISNDLCSHPIHATELNSMIIALHSRKRIRAALQLYHENKSWILHEEHGSGDSFTACALLDLLIDSINLNEEDVNKSKISNMNNKDEDEDNNCWQWQEAMVILEDFEELHQIRKNAYHSVEIMNNYVYSMFLKLNNKVLKWNEIRGYKHDGATFAISILKRMQKLNISPDVVTCTTVISTFDKTHKWKAACSLLDAMRNSKQPIITINDISKNHAETDMLSSSINSVLDSSPTHESTLSTTNTDNDWSLPKPNVYTYSAAISACARAHQLDLALNTFNSLKDDEQNDPETNHTKNVQKTSSRLERNTWVYNAVIAAYCSSGNLHSSTSKPVDYIEGIKRFEIALDLLQSMEEDAELRGMDTEPNTVTYNTILATLIGGEIAKEVMTKLIDTNSFLHDTDHYGEIRKTNDQKGKDCDQVNTSQLNEKTLNKLEHETEVFSQTSFRDEFSKEETFVNQILFKMHQKNVTRDIITYHHAILAGSKTSSWTAMRILELAYEDRQIVDETSTVESRNRLLTLVNTAFSVCASHGSIEPIIDIFSRHCMFYYHGSKKIEIKPNVVPDATTFYLMIRGMCRAGEIESALLVLCCLSGIEKSQNIIFEKYGIRIPSAIHLLEEKHYFKIIDSCIRSNNFQSAIEVLTLMKSHGKFSPSISSLTSIIIACSNKAIQESTQEIERIRTRNRRNRRRKVNVRRLDLNKAQSKANAAFSLLQSIKSSQIHPIALSSVVKASAASLLWDNAFQVLRQVHDLSLSQQKQLLEDHQHVKLASRRRSNGIGANTYLEILPKLHRFLLNICVRDGDISNALQIVEAMEQLSNEIANLKTFEATKESIAKPNWTSMDESTDFRPKVFLSSLLLTFVDEDEFLIPKNESISETTLHESIQQKIGLDTRAWRLLIFVASKSKNWQVCLGTLQILRSEIENTNPQKSSSSKSNDGEQLFLNKQYDNLSSTLSSTILCLESCNQYAWAIRAIDDWIKWSGRRPPRSAVISACRLLAARGKAQQVKELVSRIMQIQSQENISQSKSNQNLPHFPMKSNDYGLSIYSYAVHIMHENGMYDIADEIYLEGVAKGYLLWPVLDGNDVSVEESKCIDVNSPLLLDLHGMTLAIAHSAVRTALQKEVNNNLSPLEDQEWCQDVVIITGKGVNSAVRFRPILRPEVQRMLTEEFYPPLSTFSIPNNIGALQIPAKDVDLWLSYQRERRGAHMLTVANMLKSISGVSKLKWSILNLGKDQIANQISKDDEEI